MTFLSAAQSAAIRLISRRPTTFFSSSDEFELEITDLANDVVDDMVKYADWRRLTLLQSMPGDGVTFGFDLPSDYDRMPIDADVNRANWYTWGYVDAPNLNFWRDLVNGLASPNPGYWIMLDNQMQFRPAVAAGETAEFYYISKNAVLDKDGTTTKAQFQNDEDTFLLNERVLTLGLIWKWKALKGLEYSEDLANYETLIAQVSGKDRGSKILTPASRRWDIDSVWAYPRSLGV
ncbi:hypothetical protein [Ensifer sp. SL37]|uniref:hypothetical protein n=1 Tax=Ensifer sp. SL37 TaxID=2995137 RepID=UPI0022746DC9|nr:hypothetical protein [Ensifer sp. SL37]MCY1741158.1 hypothetical protein [Ensifer sp. SL37]